MAVRPKLSICMPTYNRAGYLETAFAAIFDHGDVGFSFELVVSDNHSTDDTPKVIADWSSRHPEIRSVRQPRNTGYIDNYMSVHRLALGEYAIYLADDDRLVFDVLRDVLKFMDEHPGVACAQTPWEIWGVLDVGPVTGFYDLPEQRIFGRANAIDLLNMIIINHVFPEICVYRTEPMQKIFHTPFRAFLFFVHLANILDHGDVAFLPLKYYRIVGAHPGLPPRNSVGAQDAMNNRDGYEAGLQYLALRCFQHLGHTSIPTDQLPVLRDMIRNFMDNRLVATSEMLLANKTWSRASAEFLIRRRATGLLSDEQAAELGHVPARAALEAFLGTFLGMPALHSMGVTGFDHNDAVRGRLLAIRGDARVRVIPSAAAEIPDPAGVLVLAGPHADRQALIVRGYLPGLILYESDIARLFRF
ncbi:MAG TPA: glycosyltransferase family 2 protein [Caulobacteraceae bacterium]